MTKLFRESLGLNLADEGYDVTSFSNGREDPCLSAGGRRGRRPVAGLAHGRADRDRRPAPLRRAGIAIPVIFLTGAVDDIYEAAALEGGAAISSTNPAACRSAKAAWS